MKRLVALLLLAGIGALSASYAEAQVPRAVYYQPTVQPTVVYRVAPIYRASYFTPVLAPAPAVVVAPAPVLHPVTRVRARYRPLLGGTVTRVRRGYARAYYRPAVVYGY